MATSGNPSTGKRRVVTAVAAIVAAVALPACAGVANAAAPAAAEAFLPPGVVKLQSGEPCPQGTLCLYRDYGYQGPAYGIGAGYPVDLRALPMDGGVNGHSAANEVSSWVNNTGTPALLVDVDTDHVRPLFPGHRLQEPQATNDTVDVVSWL
ncbi:peptidase inhibitor family I36 protein [Streptomyces sp. NRRL F-5126]|uniref:peptidase inhibitor family I36 protein n=1 Tax=Streptomyces sp. NRRL F-5126 TaxID=1463857 RepID=UPI00099C68CA|nr:peptidase inhibitor family I36 protein [Streptomyces sp. NRRL F-5126]